MKFIERLVSFLFLVGALSSAKGSPIDTAAAVDIGGIKQWITIKGTNDKNPVLLFLHGGPGNSAMGYADKFTGELQKHFVVVLWDQRESGKTAELNTSEKTLSVALMEDDAIQVINYLRRRFSQEKIYLMGHSWGGFLALKLAADHPEFLRACIAVSPMINQLESERLSLQWMVAKAKKEKNREAEKELSLVSIPFQTGAQLYYHRSWLLKLNGRKSPSQSFVETWSKKWLHLFNEASAVNFFVSAPELKCPVYFLVGRQDYQTHFKLTEDYHKVLKAPEKSLFWFENAGHNLTFAEPQRLQEIIIKEILPKMEN
jgi:pimeloyl-ACP methyl ester carboxylesterase